MDDNIIVKPRWEISGGALKLIAVCSMLIDHIGAVIFIYFIMRGEAYYTTYEIMRGIIGRWAFPIYCFLLVEGFEKTRSRKKYALRLFVFALISEIPFNLAFYGSVFYKNGQNVFFTLLIGLLIMGGMEFLNRKIQNIWLQSIGKLIVVLTFVASAEFICCDYGAKGIIAITLLYLFRKNRVLQMIAGCISFWWEPGALFAFIPIAFYKGKRGFGMKYFFYAFYPIHLLLLYGILQIILPTL